ncbi:MAG: hypothetical protein H3C34_27265, partial [Caldilineaceae bacterium]|nr:hypothetical protein [Caldilineaceae bacterium]
MIHFEQVSFTYPGAAQPALADDTAVHDTPTALVNSGVTSYTLAAPKVFWHTAVPLCPPTAAAAETESAPEAAAPDQANAPYTEYVRRIASYGSPIRTLYAEGRNCSGTVIWSNLAADTGFLYWLQSNGLYKLPVEANPGDPAALVNALVKGPGEVVDGGDKVFYLATEGSNKQLGYVLKSNNQRVTLVTVSSSAGNLSFDGEFVYYVEGGVLKRVNPGVSGPVNLASGVTGYYAEGARLTFCTIDPFQCFYSKNVFVAQGRKVSVYDNNTNSMGSAIYTSGDNTASIYTLVTDFSGGFFGGGNLFFFESRTIPCSPQPCFSQQTYVLIRTGRNGGTPAALYTYGPTLFSGPQKLRTDNTYLYWQEEDRVERLPNNAAALPQVNMWVTGMEVTQGIQNLANGVTLIKNRRTFVRVYVRSDGTAVPGVTAHLSSPTMGGNVLVPVNPVGTHITVRPNPNRNDINQSFLFELPWNWTQQNNLQLVVNLNPYKVPLEPTYNDNSGNVSVSFQNSPTLSAEFFRLNYTIGGTTYRPRIWEDVMKTYSWILRGYPIGGAVGDKFKPRLWDVDGGTRLGNWVNQSSIDCAQVYPKAADRSLCASYFTNGWLFYYRIATMFGILNVGLKTNAFYYGMISDGSNNFPRGQAVYSKTSVGPSGTPCSPFSLGCGWDTDGSYADWYAAHEIGHSLGRAHPNAGSDNPATSNVSENCGHSRSDPGYPYGNTSTARAPIGPADGSMEGFDGGDPAYSIPKAVLPSSTWNDVMSYCSNQWLSDYTYTGMYNNMKANPSAADAGLVQAAATGDFLAVTGVIKPDGTAGFSFVRRLDSVVNVPPLVPGAYSIRLLDAGNNPLATYAFTPDEVSHADGLGFGQVVNFVAGTRTIQILRNSDSLVMGSTAVSANPPTVSNVALQGAPNPVTGVVTLGWTASDPDGDALIFDVAYSRDNGATFQPVAINISGNSTQIDTAQLGGSGTAILRVTATDGVNSAAANSAPFVMANKPPQPFILTPVDNTQVHWGQLVNFSGVALDAQDGTVADSGLVWKNAQNATLGTGALLSLDNLPVGTNVIS